MGVFHHPLYSHLELFHIQRPKGNFEQKRGFTKYSVLLIIIITFIMN